MLFILNMASTPFSLVAVSVVVVVFVGTGPKYLGALDAGLCIQKCRAIILVSGGA